MRRIFGSNFRARRTPPCGAIGRREPLPRRPEGVVPPAINRKDRLVDAKIRDGDVLFVSQ